MLKILNFNAQYFVLQGFSLLFWISFNIGTGSTELLPEDVNIAHHHIANGYENHLDASYVESNEIEVPLYDHEVEQARKNNLEIILEDQEIENINKETADSNEKQNDIMGEEADTEHNNKSSRDEDSLPNSGAGIPHIFNITENSAVNITSCNATKNSNASQSKKVTCAVLESTSSIDNVEIINATHLLKILQSNTSITSRSTAAVCYLVYFFSPYCQFSAQGSAYVNALARSLHNIPVYGLNSIDHHSVNARYGIMGTPSLILFHNGHSVGRYNASQYGTTNLEAFISHFTNERILPINVTSQDFKSNLPSKSLPSPQYTLYVAWIFLIFCGSYVFLNSEFYASLTEAFLNNWREAEAQHQHDD